LFRRELLTSGSLKKKAITKYQEDHTLLNRKKIKKILFILSIFNSNKTKQKKIKEKKYVSVCLLRNKKIEFLTVLKNEIFFLFKKEENQESKKKKKKFISAFLKNNLII
jgi:hypothetical protein